MTISPLWLADFGFRFDPFEYLEASKDPNLNRYLIGTELSTVAWEEASSLFFAPAGAGKTALRIHTARSCWSGGGNNHPFPIHYYFPDFFENRDIAKIEHQLPTLDEHLLKILTGGAKSLFVGFAYYPEMFLDLFTDVQKRVVNYVMTYLPEAKYYVSLLREGISPDEIATRLGYAYVLYRVADQSVNRLFCNHWEKLISSSVVPMSSSIQHVFEQMIHLLTHVLSFHSIFIMVDGVDSFPELYQSPTHATRSLLELFTRSLEWRKSRVYIKGFLPFEMRQPLQEKLGPSWSKFREAELAWDEKTLIELIHKRIYAAVDRKFDSLNAMSNPVVAFDDVEKTLARVAQSNPRQMLQLAQRVLYQYELRQQTRNKSHWIEVEDVDNMMHWYQSKKTLVAPLESKTNMR